MPVGKPALRQSARIAASMTLLGAPIMAVLFVLFPRIGPLWGVPADTLGSRSGLSATMQVGSMARIALDNAIAMRVRFDGAPPASPACIFAARCSQALTGANGCPCARSFQHLCSPKLSCEFAGHR